MKKIIRSIGAFLLLGSFASTFVYIYLVKNSGTEVAKLTELSRQEIQNSNNEVNGNLKYKKFRFEFNSIELQPEMDEVTFRMNVEGSPSVIFDPSFNNRKKRKHQDHGILSLKSINTNSIIQANFNENELPLNIRSMNFGKKSDYITLGKIRVSESGPYTPIVDFQTRTVEGKSFELVAIKGALDLEMDKVILLISALIAGAIICALTREKK
ncbi:MAG: hypothetical protein K2Q18_08620 [Bdellovibrionales bacterium]|nr:hypothetical protein [Bdellovibrionales bacterium]